MGYSIKVTTQEANELIAKYLRTISDIVDIQMKYNVNNWLATDTIVYHGKEVKWFREIKLLKYIDLLQLSLKFDGYDIGMIKQICKKNETGEEVPIFICYIDVIKRGR